ncbi:hypothetical protein C8233_17955 [Halomonas sp. SF2003]|nr:hypothetical protein C8233_17955 [Halomonas sp. SF2003]
MLLSPSAGGVVSVLLSTVTGLDGPLVLPAGSVAVQSVLCRLPASGRGRPRSAILFDFGRGDRIAIAVGNVDGRPRLTGAGEGRAIGLFENRSLRRQ